jgi:hypothetical protein
MSTDALAAVRERMLKNPRNVGILGFLKVAPETTFKLQAWPHAGSGFDEGGAIFFERYGGALPDRVKLTLGYHNVMVDAETGLIFAVHYGRCTFLARGADRRRSDGAGTSETLDGLVDIRALDPEWRFLDVEDEARQLEEAYALCGRPEP